MSRGILIGQDHCSTWRDMFRHLGNDPRLSQTLEEKAIRTIYADFHKKTEYNQLLGQKITIGQLCEPLTACLQVRMVSVLKPRSVSTILDGNHIGWQLTSLIK